MVCRWPHAWSASCSAASSSLPSRSSGSSWALRRSPCSSSTGSRARRPARGPRTTRRGPGGWSGAGVFPALAPLPLPHGGQRFTVFFRRPVQLELRRPGASPPMRKGASRRRGSSSVRASSRRAPALDPAGLVDHPRPLRMVHPSLPRWVSWSRSPSLASSPVGRRLTPPRGCSPRPGRPAPGPRRTRPTGPPRSLVAGDGAEPGHRAGARRLRQRVFAAVAHRAEPLIALPAHLHSRSRAGGLAGHLASPTSGAGGRRPSPPVASRSTWGSGARAGLRDHGWGPTQAAAGDHLGPGLPRASGVSPLGPLPATASGSSRSSSRGCTGGWPGRATRTVLGSDRTVSTSPRAVIVSAHRSRSPLVGALPVLRETRPTTTGCCLGSDW